MTRCAAIGCNNTGHHIFPKQPKRRKLWEEALRRKKWKASHSSRLCADHFKPEDYYGRNSYTGDEPVHKLLKKTAVPSIFSFTEAKEELNATAQQRSDRLFRRNQTKLCYGTAIGDQVPGPSGNVTQQKCGIQIIGTKHQHNYLEKSAVPSIFPWTKTSMATEEQTVCTHTSITSESKEATPSFKEKIRCSVPQCNSKDTTETITFHSYPKNKSIRKRWIEILNVDKKITKSMKVCSLHFNRSDFVYQGDSTEDRLIRRCALPTKKQIEVLKSAVEQQNIETLFNKPESKSNMAEPSEDLVQERDDSVCRACLRRCERVNTLCDIFQAWSPPWAGMEATIAEDLAKIAYIEVPASDTYPKFICHPCYQILLDAARFAEKVRNSDNILKQTSKTVMDNNIKTETEIENNWPKPIQIDKNINGSVFERSMEIDIKQEVLSDEEQCNESGDYMDSIADLDIKVEPEEIEEQPLMQITINGTMSLNPNVNNPVLNGIEKHGEQHLQVVVKQEPMSEEENDEVVPDLSLECMLCAKSFQKITGLKAHVIAEHSYKSVKRKSTGRTSPAKKQKKMHKYICQICKRSFTTSTDLLVHETCHNMFTCYGCFLMLDSFEKLTKHQKKCAASRRMDVQRPKTLDDVLRPKLDNIKPTLDKNAVSQTNQVLDINDVSDSNLLSGTNPVADTNPCLHTDLETKTILLPDTKPVIEMDQRLNINDNQVSGIDLGSDVTHPGINKTMRNNNFVSETNPVSVINPVSKTKPDNALAVSDGPMDTLVFDTNLAKDDNKVMSDSTIDKNEDSSMKLHLEIHSSKEKSEPMKQSDLLVQNNSDAQVKSGASNSDV